MLNLSFGSSDTSKSENMSFIGKIEQIHLKVPDWTNTVTSTLTMEDVNSYKIYNSGAKNKNANYNIDREQLVPANSKVIFTLSSTGRSGENVVVAFLLREE